MKDGKKNNDQGHFSPAAERSSGSNSSAIAQTVSQRKADQLAGLISGAPAQMMDEEELQGKFPAQMMDEEELQGKFPAQMMDEEELQGKFPAQMMDEEELQGKFEAPPVQRQENANGMPGDVQAKMESTMGADFSDVNIHQNSSKAESVGALAFAQGNDVHFAQGKFDPVSTSGQELIGHELAHVVQQREGRVQPTTEVGGLPVNDDPGLEQEADVLGAKAARG